MKGLMFALVALQLNTAALNESLAQWVTDGVPISTAPQDQFRPVAVSDGASGAILVWRDIRNDNYALPDEWIGDIYAQRVSADGFASWASNGVALCTAAYGQRSPVIVSDGAGGAIVAWFDWRNGANYDVYVQRVDNAGVPLWTANGVPLCIASNDQRDPVIVSDGAGGAIVVWRDNRPGVSWGIFAQRVSAMGVPQWLTNGVALCNNTGVAFSTWHRIISDGSGGAIVVWDDYRNNTSYDIYAHRVSSFGVPQWTYNGVPISTAWAHEQNPDLVSDGNGGAIIAWEDERNSVTYWHTDVYAQRVNMSGVPQWVANGVAICNSPNDQQYVTLSSDGAGGTIIAWEDFRNGTDLNIYAQRLTIAGLPQWTANGIIVCSAQRHQQQLTSTPDGAGGIILAWMDDRNGTGVNPSTEIYLQALAPNGTVKWTQDGVAVCTAPDNQVWPSLASDSYSGAIVAWADLRNLGTTGLDIYAQHVSAWGEVGCPGGGRRVSVTPSCAAAGTVFSEPGFGFTPNADVELRFIQPDGTPDLPNPVKHTDACGSYSHTYNSATADQYGTYSYYAIDLTTGQQSSAVQFKILPTNRPNPPTGLQVENPGTGTTLKLTWNPSTSPFVEQYRIYRWTTGTPATLAGTSTTTSFEDQALTRGQEYYYAVSAADCAGEGLLSGAVTGTPEYFPVVLVHGLCSNSSAWATFATELENQGFVVHDELSMQPNTERPQTLEAQFAVYMASIPGPKVNVVAHSMGGLVVREFIARQTRVHQPTRISTLITVGTPHHGSDVASWLLDHPAIHNVLKVKQCPFRSAALQDLVTGSPFLNALNYGAGEGDPYQGKSWNVDKIEDLRDQSIRYVTFAGTQPMCAPAEDLSHGAWVENEVYYFNDGLVAASSAKLYNQSSSNWIDTQLNLGPFTHTSGIGFCGEALLGSVDLARTVADVLRGSNPTTTVSELQRISSRSSSQQLGDSLSEMSSPSGVLTVGQVVEQGFLLPSTSTLRVYLGSTDARLFLRSPTDSLVTPDDTLTTPGLRHVFDTSLSLEGYIFENPPAGNWTIKVDGSTSAQEQEYATAISIATPKSVQLRVSDRLVYSGDPVTLQAWVDSVGVPVQNASWNVTVMKPDSTAFNVQLYDDGMHGDSLASDGIFGASILPPGPVGFYQVGAQGTILSDAITIIAGTTFELVTFQDLAMDSTVSFSQGLIEAGDSVQVFGTVRNLGVDPVANVVVEFWDNITQFGVATVNVAGNGTQAVQAQWIATSPDTHRIRLTVSPFTLPLEAGYDNNSTTKIVILGQPTVGVEDRSSRFVFWLGPATPNPSRNSVTIRFTLPERSPASFEVFDILGRKIQTWHWQELHAGAHRISWDGTDVHGQAQPAGMYFYRLIAGNNNSTKKVIWLR